MRAVSTWRYPMRSASSTARFASPPAADRKTPSPSRGIRTPLFRRVVAARSAMAPVYGRNGPRHGLDRRSSARNAEAGGAQEPGEGGGLLLHRATRGAIQRAERR